MLEYNQKLKEPSQKLRKNMTDSEQLLWSRLRRKQLLDIQFYRQKPIGNYIVDFYAPAAQLVIEVDGCQHHEPEQQRKDFLRDRYLAGEGLEVLRVDNFQVLRETDAVVELIMQRIQERVKSPLYLNPP